MNQLLSHVRRVLWNNAAGEAILRLVLWSAGAAVFSERNLRLLRFDLTRLRARRLGRQQPVNVLQRRLHLGCGKRRVPGWLNVDVVDADHLLDLAQGHLPWEDSCFEAVVGQHVVEHLELFEELMPLLRELHRVAKPGAQIWLTCPDMAKVCGAYLKDKGSTLHHQFAAEFPTLNRWERIPQQLVNSIFHQDGEHKNLFDFELLAWACKDAGFIDCKSSTEKDFLEQFPEFPPRQDENHTLYFHALKPSPAASGT